MTDIIQPVADADDDFDFSLLRSKGKKLNQAKEDLDKLFAVSLGQVNEVRAKTLENAEGAILYEIKRRPIKSLSYNDISRLQLLLEGMSNDGMLDYQKWLNSEYQPIDPASVEKPKHDKPVQKMTSEEIKAFNKLEREYREEQEEITKYNNKLTALNYTLTKFIDNINYGDPTLNTAGLHNVYYRFNINENEDYTKTFIKDVQMYNPALLKNVVRITIENADLSKPMYPNETPEQDQQGGTNMGGVFVANTTTVTIPIEEEDPIFGDDAPAVTESVAPTQAGVYEANGALDVKFWFATLEDAADFESHRDSINQVYEKYIRYYRQR